MDILGWAIGDPVSHPSLRRSGSHNTTPIMFSIWIVSRLHLHLPHLPRHNLRHLSPANTESASTDASHNTEGMERLENHTCVPRDVQE